MRDISAELEVDSDEFTDTELGMLRMLSDGRCTPAYMADELDVRQEYVRGRLSDLRRLGHVKRVYRGLYELEEERKG